MTAPYRKKLIEVALPLKAINEASAREKSIRHGHPSTLHLWWARRPLAACRAVLFASLVDDPDSDPQFQKADPVTGEVTVDEDAAGTKRAQLFSLIEELVQWENSNNPEVIRSARAEIARCVASRKVELGELSKDDHLTPDYTVGRLIRDAWVLPRAMGKEAAKKGKKTEARVRYTFSTTHLPPESVVNDFLATHAPPVLDPFAGGGSIPLEAQRLGLRAYASDLNPVAVLINKALIEIPPKFAGRPPVNPKSRKDPKTKAREWRGAEGLAEDVRYYGKWMRDEAEKRIGHLYPKVNVTEEMADDRPDLKPYLGEELTVIAWLWARTVASPNPAAAGVHVPLVKSFWLCAKRGKEAWAQPIVDSSHGNWRFVVGRSSPPAGFDPAKATIGRQGATCILTGTPISFDYIRNEGSHGRMGTRLMAIVAEGQKGRIYLPPSVTHERCGQCEVVDAGIASQLPEQALGFRVQRYGIKEHQQLFSSRQLVALSSFSSLVDELRELLIAGENDPSSSEVPSETLIEQKAAVSTYLAFATSRAADAWSSLVGWRNTAEATRGTFAKQTALLTKSTTREACRR